MNLRCALFGHRLTADQQGLISVVILEPGQIRAGWCKNCGTFLKLKPVEQALLRHPMTGWRNQSLIQLDIELPPGKYTPADKRYIAEAYLRRDTIDIVSIRSNPKLPNSVVYAGFYRMDEEGRFRRLK